MVRRMSSLLVEVLDDLWDGTAELLVGASPLATVDARHRNIDVQIGPLLGARQATRSAAMQVGPSGAWEALGIPGELARQGWRVTLLDGGKELFAIGRGTSPFLGHVRVHPAALLTLGKFI